MSNLEAVTKLEAPPQYPIIKVVWKTNIRASHITSVFASIEQHLQRSDIPHFVIFDMTLTEELPLKDMTAALLFGTYQDALIAKWLIVDACEQWRLVEDVLIKATNERRAQHFGNVEDAIAYIHERTVHTD